MEWITSTLIVLIALVHFGILALEMFGWESVGPKVFKQFSADFFPITKAMAANQGLYNGFLGAGLLWSRMISDPWAWNIALFFLLCVFVAGLYGAATISRRIAYVQAVPAAVAILLLLVL